MPAGTPISQGSVRLELTSPARKKTISAAIAVTGPSTAYSSTPKTSTRRRDSRSLKPERSSASRSSAKPPPSRKTPKPTATNAAAFGASSSAPPATAIVSR
jgi:hypothetical protein